MPASPTGIRTHKDDEKQPWVKVQSAKCEGLHQEQAAEFLTSANVRVEEINKLLDKLATRRSRTSATQRVGPGELNPNSPDAMKEYANPTAGRAVAAVENERTIDKSKSLDRSVERQRAYMRLHVVR